MEKKAEKKDEAKIERIKAETEQGAAKKAKSALIVEFSIENVQVVKRRAARQEEQVSPNGTADLYFCTYSMT